MQILSIPINLLLITFQYSHYFDHVLSAILPCTGCAVRQLTATTHLGSGIKELLAEVFDRSTLWSAVVISVHKDIKPTYKLLNVLLN